MGRLTSALAIGTLVLLLAGTACGERSEPTGPLAQSYPVTVQGDADQPTVVSSVPRRVVALGPGPRQIVDALGLKRTVKVDDSLVGLALVDAIKRARPDLIVASSDSDPLDLSRASAATKAPVYVEPSNSIDGIVAGIGDVGLLTGEPIVARRVTARIQAARKRVAARLAGTRAVTAFVDTGDFSTVPVRSLLGDLVREARGTSVAGESPEQGPFPLERLLQLDPYVYLVTADSGRTLKGLRSGRARRLRAVKAGRFGVLPESASVPGPDVGRTLEEVARLLHPAAFGE
jgi:ABC-type Fe3+-hydroxamate transport system substrate-binding protein